MSITLMIDRGKTVGLLKTARIAYPDVTRRTLREPTKAFAYSFKKQMALNISISYLLQWQEVSTYA